MQLIAIKDCLRAQLQGGEHGNLVNKSISGVSIDTRTLVPGDLFVAIKGEQFDGHDFVQAAIDKGASAIILSQEVKAHYNNIPVFLVYDTVEALGVLAASHRDQFAHFALPVIGITGSNGKTTVKTMVGSIFSQIGTPLVTQGNFNNQIGLPLTLLQLNPEHDAAVIEMGASHPGDIRYLCHIAKPTITLVNNVMPAHLAGFGSLEGVAQTKGEIYEGLAQTGTAIVNQDSEFADYFQKIIRQGDNRKIITFGLDNEKNPDITAKNIVLGNASHPASRFVLVTPKGEIPIICEALGQHNILNALAASSIAFAAGIALSDIAKGFAQLSAVKGRLQRKLTVTGASVIDDTYNANPGSFSAAIEVLSAEPGATILVMGEMGELGDNAAALHEEIGVLARERGIDHLFAVGSLCAHAVKGFGVGAKLYADKLALVRALEVLLKENTTCLVKGSRSAKMETVVQQLTDTHSYDKTIGGY